MFPAPVGRKHCPQQAKRASADNWTEEKKWPGSRAHTTHIEDVP